MLPRQVLAKDTSNGPDSAPNFSSQDQIKNRLLEDANLKNTMNHNIQNKTTVLNTNATGISLMIGLIQLTTAS